LGSQFRLALGAGIFFAAYALFGIPANLILNKIGAQKWLSITTALWGVLSALTGLVQTETQFIVLRFLLGLEKPVFIPVFCCWPQSTFPIKFAPPSSVSSCSAYRWH
jgi:MFS family permease